MLPIVYAICVAVILVICILGVLHRRYDDTLLQRLGLSITALGALAELSFWWRGIFVPDAADMIFALGIAVFSVGTAVKKWRGRLQRRRASDRTPTPTRL